MMRNTLTRKSRVPDTRIPSTNAHASSYVDTRAKSLVFPGTAVICMYVQYISYRTTVSYSRRKKRATDARSSYRTVIPCTSVRAVPYLFFSKRRQRMKMKPKRRTLCSSSPLFFSFFTHTRSTSESPWPPPQTLYRHRPPHMTHLKSSLHLLLLRPQKTKNPKTQNPGRCSSVRWHCGSSPVAAHPNARASNSHHHQQCAGCSCPATDRQFSLHPQLGHGCA